MAGLPLAASIAVADEIGLSGVLFGATVLAAATALPEVSTGLTSVRLGDVQLAVSDIFGGDAFLPVLGILLTAVYIFGLIFRPRRRILRMGPDSLLVVVLYGLGLAGLIVVAGK